MAPFILSAMFLLAAGILLGVAHVREAVIRRNVITRLRGGERRRRGNVTHWGGGLFRRLADSEIVEIFNRLGWRSARQRSLFALVQVAFPVVLALLVWLGQKLGQDDQQASTLVRIMPFMVFGIAYLLPKRYLIRKADQRAERIAAEVSTLIPLLRMLFEVGMTVEQSLRVLAGSGSRILPELTRELAYVLNRVDAGLDLGQELSAMGHSLKVGELVDTVIILQQLISQGGGGMGSLLSLKELLDKRRATSLQEKVSKMSGKMSIVMMVFLFPALLIVLAGPGFMALFQALGG